MRRAAAACLLLAACDRSPHGAAPPGAGARLEQAAIAAGVVADPRAIDPVGAYASETDQVCVVRRGDRLTVGASVDYGDAQRCVARGTGRWGEQLRMDFGGGCTIAASVDGGRITFPAVISAACDRACEGRASLGALAAPRLSASPTEAMSMRAPDNQPLCRS